MKKIHGAFIALIAAAFFVGGSSAAVTEPTYVIFAIMGPQALGPETKDGIAMPEAAWHSSEKILSKK